MSDNRSNIKGWCRGWWMVGVLDGRGVWVKDGIVSVKVKVDANGAVDISVTVSGRDGFSIGAVQAEKINRVRRE